MNPEISIIVPVYKVEAYIQKCIDSILLQTFTDFELILVDDGSPDRCGSICDEYKQKDCRVIVVHKENGGLSDARNSGLNIAKGNYIGFVDSDDWIEPDMYFMLYEMCIKNECEIACCTSKIYYQNQIVTNGCNQFMIHDKHKAMKFVIEGSIYDEVVWTKLFKSNLLQDIRFKKGIVYEDTAFTYKVIHKCEKLCFAGVPKYNYVKRENSSMALATKNPRIDAVLIYDEMYEFIEKYYPDLCCLVAHKLADSAMFVLNLILQKQYYLSYKDDYYKVINILNKYFWQTIKLKSFSFSVKVLLIATKINPLLYKLLINTYSKKEELKKLIYENYKFL